MIFSAKYVKNSRYYTSGLVVVAIFLLLVSTGCQEIRNRRNNDRVLAKVHNKYLYESDLVAAIPPGISPEDSVNAAQNFINNWGRQQLLIHQAEANLTQNQKDFSKQLENYRNSLVIYEYESKIITEKLDTLVTKKEIEEYYMNNMRDFELKENIVKANYVQLDINSPDLRKLRNNWRSGKASDKTALRQYCRRNGLNYSFDNEEWIFFNDFISEVPIRTYNQEEFLRYNRNIEVQDSLYIYLVEIKNFKIRESVAPLSLQESIIRNIILNRRKLDLIQRSHEEIYEYGLKNGHFEIY